MDAPLNDATRKTPAPIGEFFELMPFTRQHIFAGLVLFVAFVIEAWEMMVIIFSSELIAADFGLSNTQIGALISALFLGMIPGSLVWGRIVDKVGRKTGLIWSLLLYTPLPLVSALSVNYEMLLVARFLGGMVLSGLLVVTFPYFEELMPVKMRGRATVYLSAGWPIGVLVAIAVTAILLPIGWRVVLGASTIIGLWALVAHRVLPESPYWLAGKGRFKDSSDVMHHLSGGRINAPFDSIEKTVDETPKRFLLSLFEGARLRLTILQTLINFCFAWGYWGLATWMPALLAEKGLNAPEGLSFIAMSALFMFPGYIAASYLTGRFGRKAVMLAFVSAATIAGFGFAYSQSLTQMYIWNFSLSFFSLGAWGIWNTWLGEIYSTDVRGAAYAWGTAIQRCANAIAPVVIGAVLAVTGFLPTVLFIASFLAVSFMAAIFLPETEGVTLK